MSADRTDSGLHFGDAGRPVPAVALVDPFAPESRTADVWMKRSWAAATAGVSVKTIDRAVAAGKIRVFRRNARDVRLWHEDVHAIVAVPSCPQESTPTR